MQKPYCQSISIFFYIIWGKSRTGQGTDCIFENPAHNDGVSDCHCKEPRTGIMPRASPSFRLPLASQAQPNASTGPDLVARPKLISAMTPVKPMGQQKYIRNQERAASVKGHSGWKHPDISMPTAEPMQARIKPQRLPKDSRLC